MNTIQEVHARCIEDGDCWIWQGAMASKKYPAFKPAKDGESLVRRLVLKLDGRAVPDGRRAACTWGEPLCVNPAHLTHSTVRAIAKKAAKNHPVSYQRRGAKLAALMRGPKGPGKLRIEDVREIRACEGKTQIALAMQYGVARSLISRILRNEVWRDTQSNPFAGLLR